MDDPHGWSELLRLYLPHLTRGVRTALRHRGRRPGREEVRELLQEVYCHLLEEEGRRLRPCRRLNAAQAGHYLKLTAFRVALDRLRAAGAAKRGHRPAGLLVVPAAPGAATRPPRTDLASRAAHRVADPRPGPERRLMLRECRRLLLRHCHLAALSRNGRDRRNLRVLRLAVFEGWTSREISEALGGELRPGSVDALVHRLRRSLAREGIHLPSRYRG